MPDQRAVILSAARDFVRREVPYVWGGASSTGTDCSGLVLQCYRAAGIELGRTTWDQWAQVTEIDEGEALPGDVILYDIGVVQNSHIGLYVGPGRMIDAPTEGKCVQEEAIWQSYPHRFGQYPALGGGGSEPPPPRALEPGLCATVTAEDGLRLHRGPGLASPVLTTLRVNSVALAGSRREQADGYWFREIAVYVAGTLVIGWAAETYLSG